MKILKNTLLLLLLSFIINNTSFSQGCSDAGVCTINTMKDHAFSILPEDKNKNHIKTGITYGLGENSISVTNPYAEFTNFISEGFSLSGKISYAFIRGELASVNNLSDVIITANKHIYKKEMSLLALSIGGKIPLNNSNAKEDNNSLPMHYQTSLGTYDLVVGLNYMYMDFGVSLALQQPLINANENEFIAPNDITLEAAKYHSTNSYNRKGDVMTRLSYNIDVVYNKLIIRPGLLSIYHLANDTYKDINGVEQEIDGSAGLTLNANIFVNYYFAHNKHLELVAGFPFVTRDARPDGLTRELVLGIEYTYSF